MSRFTDNTGDTRWEDVRDTFGGETEAAEMDDGREPEPPDPEDEPPVDLGVLTDIHARYLAEGASAEGKEAAQILLDTVPQLIAELHTARACLHAMNSWSRHYEYAVTDGNLPTDNGRRYSFEEAEAARDQLGSRAWVRTVSASPWEQHTEPPF